MKPVKKVEKTKEQIIAEAQQVLQKEAQEKQQAFMDEYATLCVKHMMELTVANVWQTTPLKK